MEEKAHQQQVLRVLKEAFAADPSQVRVEDFSHHGTVQLSRKRVRQSLDQLLQSDSEEGADAAVESACQAIMRDLTKRAKSSKGGADVELIDHGDKTILRYSAKAETGGKIAQLGARLIESTAKKLAKKFFGNFEEIMLA